MTLLMKATELVGLPVVTVDGGEDVAEVRDVVYEPEAGRLVGLTLNKRGFFGGRMAEMLTIDGVHAIGRHAVMIKDPSVLMAPGDAPEVAAQGPERNVLGNEVLTDGGTRIGTVRDLVVVVGGDGWVVGYQMDKDGGGVAYIPLPSQMAVSGSTLVVPDATSDFVLDDLVGLGAAVDEFRARLGL